MDNTLTLPAILEAALAQTLCPEDAERVRAGIADAEERPVTLRANTLLASAAEVEAALADAGIRATRVPWYADAFVLDEVRERAVWDLPLYQEGKIYLQSLSSLLPPLVLAPRPGADILDMCAAPGCKTSELAALAEGAAHITACEMKAPRAEKLRYNMEKLGVRGLNLMVCDARRLDTFFSFDQILLDAPCTGTGTLQPPLGKSAERMTEKLLEKVMRSQRALLDRALTVLKPGGELVYSTCSVLPQENEEQIVTALKKHRDCTLVPLTLAPAGEDLDEVEVPAMPASMQRVLEAVEAGDIPTLHSSLNGVVTVCPTRLFEGFFMAKIKKER